MKTPESEDRCPCCSGETFGACCGRFVAVSGGSDVPGASDVPGRRPGTAEALMRSRFTAFAVGDADYLLASWHPSTRPAELKLDPAQDWYRLDILDTVRGGPLDSGGVVSFRAYFRHHGRRETLTETSRFVREDGRWFYLEALDLR